MKTQKDSIKELISSEGVTSLVKDIGEYSLDQLVKQPELLNKFPVLNVIYGVGKIYDGVRSAIFTKKLVGFLSEIDDVDPLVRAEMIEELECDDKFVEKVGDHVLLILDRSDSMLKPAIYGAVFRAYCKKEIDSEMLMLMHWAVDKTPISYFRYLESFCLHYDTSKVNTTITAWSPQKKLSSNITNSFAMAGFATFWASASVGVEAKPNKTCKEFVSKILPKINLHSSMA